MREKTWMADDFNPVRKHADFNWFADSVAFAVNCIAEAFLLPFVFASAPGKNTVAGETAKKEAAAYPPQPLFVSMLFLNPAYLPNLPAPCSNRYRA